MIGGIEVVLGDITRQAAGAIIRGAPAGTVPDIVTDPVLGAGGPELLAALQTAGSRAAGEVVVTPGFRLPARHVIHAFAPAWRGGRQGEEPLLATTHRAILIAALDYRIKTLAMSPLGPGFPARRAAAIGIGTLYRSLTTMDAIYRVSIVCPDRHLFTIYDDALAQLDD